MQRLATEAGCGTHMSPNATKSMQNNATPAAARATIVSHAGASGRPHDNCSAVYVDLRKRYS